YIPKKVKTPPSFGFTANYIIGDTNGQRAIEDDFENDAISEYEITFPNGRGFSGNAMVEKYSLVGKIEDQIQFKATLSFTGALDDAYEAGAGLTTPYFAISESAVVTPAASGSVYSYVATVLSTVESVTVTPTATAGTITVNGETVTSSSASSAIALGDAGSVTEITIVVNESGKAPVTYTIWVSRAAS
ncbi:MAG: phage tail tube protein, partial [Syntrophomonadaceae bacterium]|nr:phage tail tube protein [Syntrophomonadaceae bacterium]